MLLKGDCRQQLATLPDNSVHAIITDPPYELGFMGKTWDSTGIAYNTEVWTQCLRVLKPGGHLLAFGGSRTYHRLASAIEDAGFEIRDQIMWVYGSGFPKSLDVSKAIDKILGVERKKIRIDASEVRNPKATGGGRDGLEGGSRPWIEKALEIGFHEKDSDEAASPAAKQWNGWGTALKPAHEPIVLARKPLDGTVANNVLTHGVGALNIDDCRVDMGDEYDATKIQRQQNSSGTIDGAFGASALIGKEIATYKPGGRWPANFIHDGSNEVLELFPDTKAGIARRTQSGGKTFGGNNDKPAMADLGYDDGGGSAARFFYCAKASRTERNTGLDELPIRQGGGMQGTADKTLKTGSGNERDGKQQNFHPTVKPLALIHYLIKLVTPPGGTILDPFLGSGTTAVAATQLGHPWIGCELTEDYWPIIEARVANAHS